MRALSRRKVLRMGFAISGGAILAACSPPGEPAADPTATSPADQPAAAPTATAAAEPTVETAPSQTPLSQVTATQPAEVSAEELTFHPTDPSKVELAAGRPQFVEFFAFW